MIRARLACPLSALLMLLTGAAQALELPFGAVQTYDEVTDPGSYAVPTGPWQEEGGLPHRSVEGAIRREAWRIDATRLTPLQIVAPIRRQLTEAGYEVELSCADRDCGGFDFRFAIEVLPAPDMFVDLTAFHFLAAHNPGGGSVTVLASSTDNAAWLQIITAGEASEAPDAVTAEPEVPPVVHEAGEGEVLQRLLDDGHVVLSDLDFASGAAGLGGGPIASLDALAEYLQDRPGAEIAFVGHTDTTGSLAVNRDLSRRRAQAAVDYLRDRHGIPASRISAEGVGYLAPRTGNRTEAGREANRRIEAVLVRAE